MSLRAELVRLGLRWLMKPTNHPGVTIEQRRRRIADFERRVPAPPSDTEMVQTRCGGIDALRVAMPRSGPSGDPARHILFLHGGGYISGSPALYLGLLWRIAAAAGARITAIDYRLAPEHPFPAALDDAAAAWRGLISQGADPQRVAIIGDSAGGGLALALALRLRDEAAALPAAIVAMSPWTDLALTGPSLRENADSDPMMNADDVPHLAACYLAGGDPRDPYASPLYGDPHGLPPTLIQVGSDEILRDDAVRMAKRMQAAGCIIDLEVWPRMPHVWQAFATMLPEARRAILRIGSFVKEHTGAAPA
ncbi:MAG TPA: alpha/beta hydrolase [Stellaceae bacterium]|nr:alpha/beta hydrolase [Stellaceae bacterium]